MIARMKMVKTKDRKVRKENEDSFSWVTMFKMRTSDKG